MAVDQPTCSCGKPETWKPVVGYEGSYEVSDHGRVRSLDRWVHHGKGDSMRRMYGKMLKPSKDAQGRMVFSLRKDGKTKQAKVHRVLMQSFVGECPPNMEVCHNDGNSTNNCICNLRYDTHSSNCMDMVIHKTHGMKFKTHCRNGHEFTEFNTLHHARKGAASQRVCRSCWAAKSYINRHPEMKSDFQAIADSYFKKFSGELDVKKAS